LLCVLTGDRANSVSPSVWWQSARVAKQALPKVHERIYQVCQLEMSDIAFVEGESGRIVLHPLTSTEAVAALLRSIGGPAAALYPQKLRACRGSD
jgi:alkyl sulfatase BDS1-like metallo-beta-lactamase superfamily hydrolase